MQTGNSADLAPLLGTSQEQGEEEEKQPSSAEAHEQCDLFIRARRRKLPDERKAITHKFSIAGHEGYLIVGMYKEGTPGEVFIKMSKEGSTLSGFMEGLALSISIGLQYGVPLKTLVDKLTNTRFEPQGFTENPSIRCASSVLDYVARWLGGKFLSPEYLNPRVTPIDHEVVQPFMSTPTINTTGCESIASSSMSGTVGDALSCSACGMLMVPIGDCCKCVNCGSQAEAHMYRG
jgi:ribonucleoside-diphosphate reductase alpha chain